MGFGQAYAIDIKEGNVSPLTKKNIWFATLAVVIIEVDISLVKSLTPPIHPADADRIESTSGTTIYTGGAV
jgi:hypothetical protein